MYHADRNNEIQCCHWVKRDHETLDCLTRKKKLKGIWFITPHPHSTPWNRETKVASTGCERSVQIANTKRTSLNILRKKMVLVDFMGRVSILLSFNFILFCVVHVFMSETHVCMVKTMERISPGGQELCSCVSSAQDWLVQFSSRWYLCARKSPYALHPVSQKFPQRCL